MTIATSEGILPCDKCGARDWQFSDEGTYCGACMDWREKDGPEAQRKRAKARPGLLAGLIAGERDLATKAQDWMNFNGPSYEHLYSLQVIKLREKVAGLEAWKAKNDKHPEFWLAEARTRYALDTLMLLQSRGHALFCPDHPPEGVPPEHGPGLAMRGALIEGEKPLAWQRYCEKCSLGTQIRQIANRLEREWNGIYGEGQETAPKGVTHEGH